MSKAENGFVERRRQFTTSAEGVEIPTENTVTDSAIEDIIEDEQYHVFPSTTMTVCCLTLTNGYTVLGESACADPHNFKQATGEFYARKDALRKIWPLEGYLMRQRLHDVNALAQD